MACTLDRTNPLGGLPPKRKFCWIMLITILQFYNSDIINIVVGGIIAIVQHIDD